jgi:hypothetical protein
MLSILLEATPSGQAQIFLMSAEVTTNADPPYVAKSYNAASSNWPQRPHYLASLIKKRGRALQIRCRRSELSAELSILALGNCFSS